MPCYGRLLPCPPRGWFPLAPGYQFRDTAFDGLPRWRSVFVSQRPDFIVVFDQALGSGAKTAFQQLWHLDPALTVTTAGAAGAIASAPGAITRR